SYPFTLGSGSGTGVTVSGTATSWGSATDDVTIQLIESGASEAAYEAVVQGNSASYSIAGVAPGTYTMKVMKQNHVTREYTVTVGAENVTQDVTICLLGDVTGDGKVNAKDYSRLYAHINKTNLLTGYELLCADVTVDGKVNAKDYSRLYAHISKTNPLW
ncbi:MAG: dockerin type I repeat-containing protein, partial [Eubacteriales bacterium]